MKIRPSRYQTSFPLLSKQAVTLSMPYTALEGSFTASDWKAMSAKEKDDVLMNYRLAYRQKTFVNWCEALGTVLANDEVKDGFSERGGHPCRKASYAPVVPQDHSLRRETFE